MAFTRLYATVLLATSFWFTSAQADLVDDCEQHADLHLRVDSCTEIIVSGKWSEDVLLWAHFGRGRAYHDLGQHQRAIEDFDQAIRRDPRSALAYYNRGLAYAALANHQLAIQSYDEAIRLDPHHAHSYIGRGNIYSDLGEHQRAIEDFDQAIRRDPRSALAYYNRGNAYAALGNYQRAIESYDEAIRLDPDHADSPHRARPVLPGAWTNATGDPAQPSWLPLECRRAIGCVSLNERVPKPDGFTWRIKPIAQHSAREPIMGDLGMRIFVAALVLVGATPASADMRDDCQQMADPHRGIDGCTAVIETANSSDVDRFMAYYNRAHAYQALGQFRRAIQDLDEAIRIDNALFAYSAYNNRGNAYADLGQLARAIEDYDQAIRLNPQDAGIVYNRGAAYLELGLYRWAIADFDEAIFLRPNYAQAYHNRGVAYAALGQHAYAMEDFARASSLLPGLTPGRGDSSDLAPHQRAIDDVGQGTPSYPGAAVAHFRQGHAHLRNGDRQRAIAEFDQAIRIDPGYAMAYYNRGHDYVALGEYQRAIENYNEAIRLEPEHVESYVSRGNVYSILNQYRRAIEDFDQAIRRDPEAALAYYNRAAAYAALGDDERATQDYDEAFRLEPDLFLPGPFLQDAAAASTGGPAQRHQVLGLDPRLGRVARRSTRHR